MAYTETKAGSGVDKTFDNSFITRNELYAILDQLKEESRFYELEVFEVVQANTLGEVFGRYVYSEQGDSIEEVQDRIFLPLNSNIIQYPLRGELWLGMSYKGQQYYLARLSENITDINFKKFNESTISENQTTDDSQGNYFIDTKPPTANVNEGDTLIQGRFGNTIRLGSNQEGGEEFIQSPNIDINVNNQITSGSKILMTTSQIVKYSEQVVEFGKSLAEIEPNGTEFVTQDYSDGQVYIDAERIVFNASKDDVAIFANNRVHIKGGKGGVQISNAKGSVSIKANEIVEDFKDGKKLQINKDLTKGDVILAPDNIQEMGAILAKQVEWNLDFIKVQIGSLVPAGIPGLKRFKVNPIWFKNVKDKIKNAKRLLEFNDLVLKLKWLDKSKWKTYTMKELKEAFKPIPGFGSIIDGFASLKQLKGNIDNVKAQIDEKVKALEAIKSGELLNVANVVNGLKDGLVDGAIKGLGLEKAQDLRNKMEDLEKTGQSISKFTGGSGLKQRLDTYTKLEELVQQTFPTDPGYQSLVKRRDESSEKLNSYIERGSADGFDQRVSEIDIDVQALSGGMNLLEAMVEVQDEAEKIESVTS
jgi:hypothetical protein